MLARLGHVCPRRAARLHGRRGLSSDPAIARKKARCVPAFPRL